MLENWIKPQIPEEEELDERLHAARSKLSVLQMQIKEHGLPVLVLFEGWGTAGKGSVLGKVIKNIDPRFFKVATKIFADFSEYYQKHCQVKTRAYDGILDLIKELKKRNIKMAIVSNKNYKAVESLKNIYFEGLIDVALGENEAAGIKKKPAKDMVMSALDKLGSTQEKSIYVGDSEVDSQTAVNSGLDCILVSWGFRTKDILEKLAYKKIIDEPMQLLDVIE